LFSKIDRRSLFLVKKLIIKSQGKKNLPLKTETNKILKTPVAIHIAKAKIDIIVGKNRLF
jgi:hypothetical protein